MNDKFQPYDVDRQIKQRIIRQRYGCGTYHERNVDQYEICECQLKIGKQLAAFRNGPNDGSKIIIQQYDGGDFARRILRELPSHPASNGASS